MKRAHVVSVVVLVGVLTGCSGGTPDPGPSPSATDTGTAAPSPTSSPTPTPAPAPTPVATSTDTSTTPFDANTERDTEDPQGNPALVKVAFVEGAGYDEIAFVPSDDGSFGWDVEYTDKPTSDGSGELVSVDGGAFLSVRLVGVAAPFDRPESRDKADPDVSGATVIIDAVDDAWFEGYWTFFVGLDQIRPFRVVRDDDGRVLLQIDTTG